MRKYIFLSQFMANSGAVCVIMHEDNDGHHVGGACTLHIRAIWSASALVCAAAYHHVMGGGVCPREGLRLTDTGANRTQQLISYKEEFD
jgi:hypothetical protein